MMQQTAVSPQLQALMTLAQGTQQGAVSPVTPDGRPTVAGQLLQQAAPQPTAPQGVPPGMPQMRQNAGIAGQIQAMQMQEAQKTLMGQAQAQQRAQQQAPVLGGGIAMAPGAQGMRMAEGGIVGYANGGGVAPDYSAAEEMRKQGLGAFERYETEPPAPAAVGRQMQTQDEELRRQMLARGLDPDYLAKEIERRNKLSEREVALYEQREREARDAAQRRGLVAFLTGARGRNPFAPAVEAGQASDAASQAVIQKAQDAALAAQKAAAQEQFLLRQAQDQTARGDWKGAQESLAKAQEARNVRALEEGKARMQAAGQMGQEATSAAQIAAQIRGQDKTLEAARIGAAAREGGIGGKAVNMALTRLQSNPDYKKTADEIARYEAYPESIRDTPSAKARLDELYAKQKALESAMEGAFDLQPGTIALTLRNMRGAGAGAGATGAPDTAKRTLKYNPATGKIE